MTTETERAEFEKAMADVPYAAELFARRTDGEYLYTRGELAWQAWQKCAARSRSGAVPAGCALVPIEPTQHMREAGGLWTRTHEEVEDGVNPTDRSMCAAVNAWRAMLAAAPEPQQAAPVSPHHGDAAVEFTEERRRAYAPASAAGPEDMAVYDRIAGSHLDSIQPAIPATPGVHCIPRGFSEGAAPVSDPADAREGVEYRANFPEKFWDANELLHDYIAYANAPDHGFADESMRLHKLNERAKAMGLNPPKPEGSAT